MISPATLAILVPQGAEYQAVCRGIRRGGISPSLVLPIPVGIQPVSHHLKQLQGQSDWVQPLQILGMGLCGSLSPQCRIGDRLLYRDCVGPASLPYACDLPLTEWLQTHLSPPLPQVRALTSDRLVWSAQDKRTLGRTHAAQVVDMEGTAILEFFQPTGLAVAMLRVVSDEVHQDLPDLTPALDPQGHLQPLLLALGMLRQPIAAARLIRGAIAGLKTLETTATAISELLRVD